MDELREITVQYTSCADPTESLARKQRVLQGENRGLMAETAEQIIATAARLNQLSELPNQDKSGATLLEPLTENNLPEQQLEEPSLEGPLLQNQSTKAPFISQGPNLAKETKF